MSISFAKAALPTLALLLAATAHPALALPADFAEKADAYVESAWPADGPGAAVVVSEGGKIVYSRGQGLADLEAKKPITPATVFRLGSITKQFSAAVLLQLVEEGKLSLDDPVSKFVPSLPEPGAGATVRQLLNHTSGVQSYTSIPGWMVEENTAKAHSTDEMVALFKDLPAPSRPGEAWAYNNSGYVLVGAVIEKVTGKPWHEAVAERLTGPLRLESIRYGVGEAAIPAMARGYTDGKEGQVPSRRIHMSVPHAAGALVGSVVDLAVWGNALHRGKVLKPSSYSAMIAPTRLPNGEEAPYGFGLGREKVRGRDALGHGGGIFGFSTDSVYIPEKDLFVAVFANSDDPASSPGIASQLLAALAIGDPFPVFEKAAVDPASLEPLFGVYAAEGVERSFYARDGQLYTRRAGAGEMKVYAAGEDRFFYGPDSLTWFRIRRDAGAAPVMEMHQQGVHESEASARTGPVPPEALPLALPRTTLEPYVGAYRVGPARLVIAWGAGDRLMIEWPGDEPRSLLARSTSEFEVEGIGATVTFHSAAGKATHIVVRMPNGRELKAERAPD